MSCIDTPVSQAVTRLKTFEARRRLSGSRRWRFQPLTRSVPLSSSASSFGMSAGSSWPSPSMVTIVAPEACSKPAASAADLPKLRRSRTPRIWGRSTASSSTSSVVPSVEPSSTTIASQPSPSGSQARAISSSSPGSASRSLSAGMTTDRSGPFIASGRP